MEDCGKRAFMISRMQDSSNIESLRASLFATGKVPSRLGWLTIAGGLAQSHHVFPGPFHARDLAWLSGARSDC